MSFVLELFLMENEMSYHTALLTGAAGGLGSCTARYLCERGWRVFAADVNDRALAELAGIPGITPLQLDVTDPASIAAALDEVQSKTDDLDGLVYLASIIAMGSLIEMDEATLFRVLNINALGVYRVTRAFFPLVLKCRGRIVNLSSETGWQSGAPFNGAYTMSKHMVEVYSDSLRRELAPLDVPVIKILLGPVKTAMVQGLAATMDRAIEASVYFKPILRRMKTIIVGEYDRAQDPIRVCRVVHEALTTARPRISYSIKPAREGVLVEKLPVRWADALMKWRLSG
jgi:NAD(P)-dependent dehydrogenase (short-subunit alcohol dehydrogenase family)